MDWQRRSLRAGTWAVVLAVGLRLISNGVPTQIWEWLRQPETAAMILYLETGKLFRPPPQTEPPETAPPAVTVAPTEPSEVLPVFAASDAALVYVRDTSGNTADVSALLEQALVWDLQTDAPSVLIYHTHATESYTKGSGDTYEESGDYRTLDTDYNMVSIGRRLAARLEESGIGVIHAQALHDYPSYDGGYDNSRRTVTDALTRQDGIRLVLDLHRDAAVDAKGRQFATSAEVKGQASAQLLFLVGTGHPNWRENMALAVKLTAQLEKMYPGITRGIITRTYSYNQELSPGALLVEVGAAGDTRAKALVAVDALAEAITALANGTG